MILRPKGLRARMRAVALALFVGTLGAAAATTYLAMTLDEMVAATEIAVYGVVESTTVEERDQMPWTRIAITVERDLAPADGGLGQLELWLLGGTLPAGPSLVVAGMPRLEPGERVLVLAYDDDFASPIVGFRQGLWRVVGDRLVAEDGRRLGFDGDALALDGDPAPIDALLDALQERLEARP